MTRNRMSPMRRRTRKPAALKAAALSVAVVALGALAAQGAGAATSGQGQVSQAGAAPAWAALSAKSAAAFHQTKTMERVNLINGKNVVVDKRTVSLSVDTTRNLANQQEINVSWTGAHPTGGITSAVAGGDPNGPSSEYQEYPMVLLQCHGTGSSKTSLSQQIQPKDCWTTTPQERFFTPASGDYEFPPWRLDRYATAADQRNLSVGAPSPEPSACSGLYFSSFANYWLPYVTPDGKTYRVGPSGCAGMPNEMNDLGYGGLLPDNETYAITNVDGRGTSEFDVWTSQTNLDLGCSQSVRCALVAVPIMGISCDPAAKSMPADDQPTGTQEQQAAAECEETGAFAAGQPAPQGSSGPSGEQDLTVTGELWWAASNWRNRFVVPLTFAPPSNECASISSSRNVAIYGSEFVDQAMEQWQPHFCLNKKLFSLSYESEDEPEALTTLQSGAPVSSSVEAALTTDQPSPPAGSKNAFPEPVVHAPVADTGFAISFVIDNDVTHQPVTTLNLDPRLLAKLLTESYLGDTIMENDPELQHACPGVPITGSSPPMCTNPVNITDDPEFQALNPGIPETNALQVTSSFLLMLQGNADLTYALTSYIESNPAARAWLSGKPDPWGMVVNSAYKGINKMMPTYTWPLLSTYVPQTWVKEPSEGPGLCYSEDPSPALPLFDDPQPNLLDISEDLQFYQSQVQNTCGGLTTSVLPGATYLTNQGQETVGYRFMIGATTLADAERYGLDTASLLTYTKPGTPTDFTSAAGMTFTKPTTTSLRAAAALLRMDKPAHDWTFPYSLYTSNSKKAAGAYPGSMLVYADVPTADLPIVRSSGKSLDAEDYAAFVKFAATSGQKPGGGVGELPAGYLPMTAANHLGAEANYAVRAAAAIAAQKGSIPNLVAPKSSKTSRSSPSPGNSTSGTGSSGSGSSGSSPTSSASPSASASPSPGTSLPARLAMTPVANFGLADDLLPVIAGLLVVAAAGAVLFFRLTRPKGR
jgi:hypothetical protein